MMSLKDSISQKIEALPHIKSSIKSIRSKAKSGISIESSDISPTQKEQILSLAKELLPWRKGGIDLFGTYIDTEWVSSIKYDLLSPYIDIGDKIVADIGCNNGYYMFEMMLSSSTPPRKMIGFDPSDIYHKQFLFLNHFLDMPIIYEKLGVESLPSYKDKFDLLLCLGVIYHRYDPINMLKSLKQSLNKNGEVLLDSFVIHSQKELVLSPSKSYAGMSNAYFIPSIPALQGWALRAGFKSCELIAKRRSSLKEQRKTKWINGHSLESFLIKDDKINTFKTIEGYSCPIRAYFKLKI